MLVAIRTGVNPSPPARSRAKSIKTKPEKMASVNHAYVSGWMNFTKIEITPTTTRPSSAIMKIPWKRRRSSPVAYTMAASANIPSPVVRTEGADGLADHRSDADALAEGERIKEEQR